MLNGLAREVGGIKEHYEVINATDYKGATITVTLAQPYEDDPLADGYVFFIELDGKVYESDREYYTDNALYNDAMQCIEILKGEI